VIHQDKDPAQIALEDALRDITRKERRNLIGFAAMGLFIAQAGLVPSRISALGIDFDKADQRYFTVGIAFGIVYFTVAFTLYAWADFLAWRLREINAVNEAADAAGRRAADDSHPLSKPVRDTTHEQLSRLALFQAPWISRFIPMLVKSTSFLRILFDFVFPVWLGIYAISKLV
jgi:hypothetical protein